MARVEVVSDEESEAQDVPVDDVSSEESEESSDRREGRRERRSRQSSAPEVEIEREVTKRRIIESVTQVVVVILYMAFTLLREKDAGVVVLDDEGPEDDWDE